MKLEEAWELSLPNNDLIAKWAYRPSDQEIDHEMSAYEPGTHFILQAKIILRN